MTWRRDRVPPIVPAALGSDASAVGAAESAFAALFAGDLPELVRGGAATVQVPAIAARTPSYS